MLVRWIAGILLAFSLALVAILASQNRTLRDRNSALALRSSELTSGQFVPPFRVRTTSGDSLSIADAADGKRDVLYVFTWTCPYCRESLPAVNALTDRLASSGGSRARLIGVSLDSLARPNDPRLDLYQFPIIRFPERRYQRLYRASSVPQLVVLSDSGRVLFTRHGVVNKEVVDSISAVISLPETPKRPVARD